MTWSRLDDLLAETREVRPALALARLPGSSHLPAGWRCEDALGIGAADQFVTVETAAEQMGLPPSEIVRLVYARALDARPGRGEMLVRPAVVSILHVRDPRIPAEPRRRVEPEAPPPEPVPGGALDWFGKTKQ